MCLWRASEKYITGARAVLKDEKDVEGSGGGLSQGTISAFT
jgi:hypothetical protein